MAVATVDLHMLARQWKVGLVVVEIHVLPRGRHVARATIVSELAVVCVVALMARVARVGRGLQVGRGAGGGVTVDTRRGGVRALQGKDHIVRKSCSIRVEAVVTAQARGAKSVKVRGCVGSVKCAVAVGAYHYVEL